MHLHSLISFYITSQVQRRVYEICTDILEAGIANLINPFAANPKFVGLWKRT